MIGFSVKRFPDSIFDVRVRHLDDWVGMCMRLLDPYLTVTFYVELGKVLPRFDQAVV